jgi:ATP-binding cassette subfamily F protein 3
MLKVSNVGKIYGDDTVLENVSFIINPGEKVGLIGPNGCGKSTLLRIVAGQETATEGSVQLTPLDLRCGYLEQGQSYAAGETMGNWLQVGVAQLEAAETRVAELSTSLAAARGAEQSRLLQEYSQALARLESLAVSQAGAPAAQAVLKELGLLPVATLSGGQRTRLGLARLLLDNPQLVLLDEPTNHLDIEALEWLEEWLQQSYRGAALIVSHDRTFLDNIVTRILDLEPETHTLTEYAGNYTSYLETWEKRREKQWARWRDERAEIQALRVELATTPGQPTIRRYAKKVARKAKSRERKLERYLAGDERAAKPASSWRMKLEFVDTPVSGQDVLLLEDLAVGYADVPLFSHVNAMLGAGERVALVGPNGTGKTTLLRVIMGQLPPLAGRARLGSNVRVGYYAQEQEALDPDSTPFESLRAVAALSETEARSFLHYFLFSGDAVFVPIGALSYGERARLVLARLVATGCNLLLLDEPINHLDIPSREQFERAMMAFQGTVLAVVHDRYFIRRFATRIWAIADGTLRSYVDLEDMQRMRRKSRVVPQ